MAKYIVRFGSSYNWPLLPVVHVRQEYLIYPFFSSGGRPFGKPSMPIRILLSCERAEELDGQRRQLSISISGQ